VIASILGGLIGLAGIVVVLRVVVGFGAMLLRRRGVAAGDERLVSVLEGARDLHSRRIAVAVIGSPDQQAVRTATLGCDDDHVFEIGSVSKAITGMLLADAEHRGELKLTDRLGDHLPELEDRPSAGVTISALGAHRSGLPRLALDVLAVPRLFGYVLLGTNPYAGQRASLVIRGARRARIRHPGEQAYSNLGAALAGVALERATGSSYETLVRDRLATPLGLTRTSAQPRASRRAGSTRWGRWIQPWRMSGYAPAGGVTSSIDDLAVLAVALLRGVAPGAQSIDRDGCFWVRERLPDGSRVVWHNGQTGGYAAYLGLRPDAGRAVVVLADTADVRLVTRVARAASSP